MSDGARDRFVILGAGRVGTAMGHLIQKNGGRIEAVVSRSEASLKRARRYLKGALLTTDVRELPEKANAFIITTPDDSIADACLDLATSRPLDRSCRVMHMSGMLKLDVLGAAEEKGAEVLCVHPLQTFADIRTAIKKIPGTVFAVTARSRRGEEWAKRLVAKLGGELVLLEERHKPLYHLGAVIASNLLVALEHAAELIYQDIGLKGDSALRALMPLIEGTVENLRRLGTERALTGPVARGDIGVVRRHLETLEELGEEAALKAYVSLSLYALDLARPGLSGARGDEIENLLLKHLRE